MVEVIVGQNESFETALKRFNRKVQQYGILSEARRRELEGPALDVTLPGRVRRHGALHPVRQVEEEVIDALVSLGFEVADGPEVELVDYNFTKLGFAPETQAQLEEVLAVGKRTNTRVGKVLVNLGYATEEDIARALADQYGIPLDRQHILQIAQV